MQFLGVYMLHREEMQYKLDHVTEAMFERFKQGEVAELVDVTRPSAARLARPLRARSSVGEPPSTREVAGSKPAAPIV